jgi:hypothetical protein
LPRRPETEEDTRDEREPQAEEKDPAVQRQILKSRNALRRKGHKDVAAPRREAKPKDAAEEREDEALY